MEAWDVVVVGGGIAALRAAISASDAGASVTVLSAGAPASLEGNPSCGLAASLGETDHTGHAADTMRVGSELCESDVVTRVTASASNHLSELERWGLMLRRDGNGLPELGLLPGQSTARTASTGDSTPREVLALLEEQCIKRRIPRRGDIEVLDLVLTESGSRGLIALDIQSGEILGIQAKAIILASAGHEGAWNGDDVGMGTAASLVLRSDLALADLEFASLHPLTVAEVGLHLPLDLLGAGGVVNGPDGSPLACDDGPDALARAILSTDGASLDLSGISRADHAWFAGVSTTLASRCGIDAATECIPLMPTVDQTIGGIPTDADGAVINRDWNALVPGLFAAGDAACSGLHGAAANSGDHMLGALDGGATSGTSAAAHATSTRFSGSSAISAALSEAHHMHDRVLAAAGNGGTSAGALLESLSLTMRTYMGTERDAAGLSAAAAAITELRSAESSIHDTSPVMNMELVSMRRTQGLLNIAEAAVAAALAREESRGCHVRSDHPETDASQAHHSLVAGDGTVGALALRN